jgi:hypothetical protein
MMVSRLNQFPAFRPFLLKKIFQLFEASSAGIMDKALTRLVAFNHRLLLAPGVRECMKRDVIFPPSHRLTFSSISSPLARRYHPSF